MALFNNSNMKRDYARDMKRAWRSCRLDVAAWALLCAAVAAGIAWLLFGPLPHTLQLYRAAGICALCACALLFGCALVSALARLRALPRIAERSVYAVMLTAEEQARIVQRLSAQAALRHFSLYAAVLLPVGTLMGALWLATGDSSVLLALALVALVGFFLTVAAQTLQSVSYATKDGFCTVADCGIIIGEDVLVYSAAAGDVFALLRFENCYSLRFFTRGLLGGRRSTEFPLPVGGAISRGREGQDADALLCEVLHVAQLTPIEGEYRPIRDDELPCVSAPVTEAAEPAAKAEEQVNETKVRIAAACAAVLLLAAAVYSIWFKAPPAAPQTPKPDVQDAPVLQQDPFDDVLPISQPFQDEDGAWYVTIGGERMLLVNKQYALPAGFGGENAEAMAAMNEMIAAAKADGAEFYVVSGYRSYELQSSLWQRKVEAVGEQQADIWVARPGTSEHQSGLAFDVDIVNNPGEALTGAFADTAAFSWLNAHAAQYGFILRYPENATWATGYGYEPWHFRYVGKTLAPVLVESGVTVEEFLGLAAAAQ